MALQSSGSISLSQIYAEVVQQAHNGSATITLNNMGLTADQYGGGFNTTNPDYMSEFYGWAYYYPPTVAFTGTAPAWNDGAGNYTISSPAATDATFNNSFYASMTGATAFRPGQIFGGGGGAGVTTFSAEL